MPGGGVDVSCPIAEQDRNWAIRATVSAIFIRGLANDFDWEMLPPNLSFPGRFRGGLGARRGICPIRRHPT